MHSNSLIHKYKCEHVSCPNYNKARWYFNAEGVHLKLMISHLWSWSIAINNDKASLDCRCTQGQRSRTPFIKAKNYPLWCLHIVKKQSFNLVKLIQQVKIWNYYVIYNAPNNILICYQYGYAIGPDWIAHHFRDLLKETLLETCNKINMSNHWIHGCQRKCW